MPIFEELEAVGCDSACSWWLINLTEKHDLWHLTYDWVKRQRRDPSYLLDTGYGATIWSKRGEIKESIPRTYSIETLKEVHQRYIASCD